MLRLHLHFSPYVYVSYVSQGLGQYTTRFLIFASFKKRRVFHSTGTMDFLTRNLPVCLSFDRKKIASKISREDLPVTQNSPEDFLLSQ